MRVYHHYLLKENIVLEARLKGDVFGLENSSCCISYYVLSLSRALPLCLRFVHYQHFPVNGISRGCFDSSLA